MALKRGELEIPNEPDRFVYFESMMPRPGHDSDELMSAVIVEVSGIAEAEELVETMNRRSGQKKRERKAEPEKPTPPPKCIAPTCQMSVMGAADFCAVHVVVPVDVKEKWIAEAAQVTTPKDGRARARGIAESLERPAGPAEAKPA